MEQMMNQFYKKEKKPRVPKFRKEPSKKVQTFTMDEMMATIGDSDDILLSGTGLEEFKPPNPRRPKPNPKYTSNTGGQRQTPNRNPKTGNKRTFNVQANKRSRMNANNAKRLKSPKRYTPNKKSDNKHQSGHSSSFERVSQGDSHGDQYQDSGVQTELDKMRADLKQVRREASPRENLGGRDPNSNGLDNIMNDGVPLPKAHEVKRRVDFEEKEEVRKEVNMKEAIKYMTREERAEYIASKRRRKRAKLEKEERKKNCFKPKINKKSKRIDKERMQDFKFKRHDMLFGLGTVLKQREEQLREMVEAENFMRFAQDELKECTFKPRINQTGHSNFNGGSIADRSKAFMAKKKMRLEEQQKIREMDELRNCTFEPKTNQKTKSALGHYRSKRQE